MEILSEEKLPINITVGSELRALFPKIASIGERLSAQLNFQTMLNGWYADEDNLLSIYFCLDIPSVYDNQKCLLQADYDGDHELQAFSDDVCYCFKKSLNHLNVLIAITESEQLFLQQNDKVLKKYLETKLLKITNLLAKQLSLNEIPSQ